MMTTKFLLCLLIYFQLSKCVISQELERAITNGRHAKLGQFKYVVFLKNVPIGKENLEGFTCTGTILTDLWVVSVAECYNGYAAKKVKLSDVLTYVTAGTVDHSSSTSHTQVRKALHHVLMEPNKSKSKDFPRYYNNDVAIIKVCEPFVFNTKVGSISVAKRSLLSGKMTCTMMGFGRSGGNAGKENTKLYFTEGSLDAGKRPCGKLIKNHSSDWDEGHLCVEPLDYRKTPCNKDWGGPIVCKGMHTGVFSGWYNLHNEKEWCGTKDTLYVYMFLGDHEEWLKQHIPELPAFRMSQASARALDRDRATTGGGNIRYRVGDFRLAVNLVSILHCIIRSYRENT